MLCTLVERAPEGSDWIHEIKLDGYRMQAVIAGGKARLLTRNGHDWTERFPETAAALGRLPDAILDGEIVAADAQGNPDFAALQAAMEQIAGGKAAAAGSRCRCYGGCPSGAGLGSCGCEASNPQPGAPDGQP